MLAGGGGGADVYFLRISEGKKLLVMLSAAHSEGGRGTDQTVYGNTKVCESHSFSVISLFL